MEVSVVKNGYISKDIQTIQFKTASNFEVIGSSNYIVVRWYNCLQSLIIYHALPILTVVTMVVTWYTTWLHINTHRSIYSSSNVQWEAITYVVHMFTIWVNEIQNVNLWNMSPRACWDFEASASKRLESGDRNSIRHFTHWTQWYSQVFFC